MYNYQNYADKRFNSNKVKRYQKDGVLFFLCFAIQQDYIIYHQIIHKLTDY